VVLESAGGSLSNLSGAEIYGGKGRVIGYQASGGGGNGGDGADLSGGATLYNAGRILAGGGGGGDTPAFAGSGGVGVSLNATLGMSSNVGTIEGGYGGYGGQVVLGGAGGVGLRLTGTTPTTAAFSNETSGLLYGGHGGKGATGGHGGAGALVAQGAMLLNYGTIRGGVAGEGEYDDGTAGTGVDLSGTLDNSGAITGGGGGNGGDGLYLAASGTLDNQAGATITGGAGAASGQAEGTMSGSAGAGGFGIAMAAGAQLGLDDGTIQGGNGGTGYYDEATNPGDAGAGGVGISVGPGALLTVGSATHAGVAINGGNGGLSNSFYSGNGTGEGSQPGAGGAGILVVDGTAIVIAGAIHGGYGGYDHAGSLPGGAGGAGVLLAGSGSLTAGSGASFQGGGGEGGGNYNTVPFGATGDAVQFVAAPSTTGSLTIDSGAVFDGTVDGGASGGAHTDLILAGAVGGTLSGGLGTQFDNFHDLTFATGSRWTVDAPAGAAGGIESLANVYGFVAGDVIDLTDLKLNPNPDDVSATFSDGVLTVEDGGTTVHIDIDENPGTTFSLASAGAIGIDITTSATVAPTPCFRLGTRILTPHGELPVEHLRIGDAVVTMSGASHAIHWIGRRHYSSTQVARNADALPVLIRAGALGDGLPRRDLWVSPDHALFIDGVLIPARALVNGESIRTDRPDGAITYLHLELGAHVILVAEGALTESFVDDESREQFDNAAEFKRLYPGTPIGRARLCAPRMEEGERVEAVRRRLAPGAAPRNHFPLADAALCLSGKAI
jgi:hypothetical protein